MLGVEPLNGAHGLPVVAELPVVVVLHDEPARGPRPVDHRRAPRRVQGPAGRELMGGRQQDGPVAAGQFTDPGPVPVDAHGPGADAVRGEQPAVEGQPVRLRRPRPAHHLRQEPQPVRGARAEDDAFRGGPHPAYPGQICGQCPPQLGPPVRIAGPERVVGGGGERPPRGGQPGGTREGGGVRLPLDQVVDGAGGAFRGAGAVGRGDGRGPLGDPGARALAGGEPALRDELRVGVGDGVTGEPQVGGEGTVRRQPRTRSEPPAADGLAECAHQDGPAIARTGELQRQITAQDLRRIDPRFSHRNAPHNQSPAPLDSYP
ncbi:hypothetical protein SCYAM73S_04536 [Streptomyces cyaneofuscatus]